MTWECTQPELQILVLPKFSCSEEVPLHDLKFGTCCTLSECKIIGSVFALSLSLLIYITNFCWYIQFLASFFKELTEEGNIVGTSCRILPWPIQKISQ